MRRRKLEEALTYFTRENESLKAKLASADRKLKEQQEILDRDESLAEELAASRAQAEALAKKLSAAEQKLSERELVLQQAGSIADASMQLNGVFYAAQKAADQYLESIRLRDQRTEQRCAAREAKSRAKADQMVREAEESCEAMRQKAKEESARYWEEVSRRLQNASLAAAPKKVLRPVNQEHEDEKPETDRVG